MALLRVEDLHRPPLAPVSLELEAGTCLGLSGPSGAGKSLLLRAIADLDPNHGEVWLDGQPRSGIAAPLWRRQVGLLPPESAWWAETVADHFSLPPAGEFQRLGLAPGIAHQAIARLSSGERQRLAMLRLLGNRSRVLLLDEPTANLDPDSTRQVEERILTYMAETGAGIIWVSHNPGQLQRVATRTARVEDGRLVPEASA